MSCSPNHLDDSDLDTVPLRFDAAAASDTEVREAHQTMAAEEALAQVGDWVVGLEDR